MKLPGSGTYAFWLSLVRLYTGVFWLVHGVPKFTQSQSFVPPNGEIVPFLNTAITSSSGAYQSFLTNIVLPNAALFAELVRLGEVVTGALLVLGFFTRLGSSIGMLLALNYIAAKGGLNHAGAWTGLDATALVLCAINAVLPTGRFLGIDGLLRRSRRAGTLPVANAPTVAGVRAEFVDEPPLNGPSAPSA